jgi:hypothetical protein
MRAIACSLVLGLFPAFVLAEEIQYTFSGFVDDEAAPPGLAHWDGPGPEPQNFVMTFDVDTLAAGNTLSYTLYNSSMGPSINSINVSVEATNFRLSVDGQLVLQSATGGFGFSGTTFGPFSFIGGTVSASMSAGAGFTSLPDFSLGTTLQADLAASGDPLGLLLNGSSFASEPQFNTFVYSGSLMGVEMSGRGTAVSVPEPGTLALLALAGFGLLFVHRRRAPDQLSRA